MHHHLRSRSTWPKQGPFPPMRLCCPHHHQYYEPLRLLIRLFPGFHFFSLYQRLRWVWTIDRMRSLLFRRLLSPHPVPSTPGKPALPPRVLHCEYSTASTRGRRGRRGGELVEGFFGAAFPGSSRLPWPSLCMTSSALPCSPSGANLSTLQGLLYAAGCWFAPPSRRHTTLQHNRSPESTGCLLRGLLAVTPTRLSPVSR